METGNSSIALELLMVNVCPGLTEAGAVPETVTLTGWAGIDRP